MSRMSPYNAPSINNNQTFFGNKPSAEDARVFIQCFKTYLASDDRVGCLNPVDFLSRMGRNDRHLNSDNASQLLSLFSTPFAIGSEGETITLHDFMLEELKKPNLEAQRILISCLLQFKHNGAEINWNDLEDNDLKFIKKNMKPFQKILFFGTAEQQNKLVLALREIIHNGIKEVECLAYSSNNTTTGLESFSTLEIKEPLLRLQNTLTELKSTDAYRIEHFFTELDRQENVLASGVLKESPHQNFLVNILLKCKIYVQELISGKSPSKSGSQFIDNFNKLEKEASETVQPETYYSIN